MAMTIRIILAATASVMLAAACSPSGGETAPPELTIDDAWVRPPLGGRNVASGYFTVRNAGGADRLVAARCTCAETTELHTHVHVGDVMRMEPVAGYDVPAHGELAIVPGGHHLMFFGLAMDLMSGSADTGPVDIVLVFERAGEVAVRADVRRLGLDTGGAGSAPGHSGHGSGHDPQGDLQDDQDG